MKMFIQYLDYGVGGSMVEPCGDRSVLIVDGRCSFASAKIIARENNGKYRPVYLGFRIYKGDFKHSSFMYEEIF